MLGLTVDLLPPLLYLRMQVVDELNSLLQQNYKPKKHTTRDNTVRSGEETLQETRYCHESLNTVIDKRTFEHLVRAHGRTRVAPTPRESNIDFDITMDYGDHLAAVLEVLEQIMFFGLFNPQKLAIEHYATPNLVRFY